MQIRVHAEALGFHGCSAVEEHRCNRRLGALIATQLALFNRRFMLTLVVNLFDYLGSILNYLVIAIPIFAGLYDDRTPQELSALISQVGGEGLYGVRRGGRGGGDMRLQSGVEFSVVNRDML